METNFSKPNPKKILGYFMALAMVFFTTSYAIAQTSVDITVGGGSYDSEISWDLTDVNGAVIASGPTGSVSATVNLGDCYDMNMYDSYGDGWNGATYSITDIATGDVYGTGGLLTGATGTDNVCMTPPAACTDNEVDFNMYDSFGDGWDMGAYQVIDDAGNVVASGTCSGAASTDALCLPTGCYTVIVGGSSWASEVSFDFAGVSGGEGTYNYVSVGGALCGPAGCMDSTAINYDPAAISDDGSCIYPVPGCTDANASNYDSTATVDDGSCCFDYVLTCDGGMWQSEVSWSIVDAAGNTVASGGAPYVGTVCLADDCYTVNMNDAFGDGWNGNVLTVSTSVGSFASDGLVTGTTGSFTFCTPPAGCTDATANNYDPVAVADDGSCLYACAAAYCSDFEAGVGTWTNNGWIWDSMGTTSSFTGPSSGANGSAYYMYYETSGAPQNPISMTSECMDISALSAPALSFYYHMYGATMGTLDVLVNGTNVWSMSGDQGNQWNWAQVDLSAYAGLDVTLEFVGNYGTSFTGDMAIDDICIVEYQVIDGCTDPIALNYDPLANNDDGSCTYCTDNLIDITCTGGIFQTEVSWVLYDSQGNNVLAGGAPYSSTECLPNDCYTLDMVDSWGDGWNGNTFTMSIGGAVLGTSTLLTGTNGSAFFSVGVACPVLGCTDSTAFNYDVLADTDDGSCYPVIYGCLDPTAVNYALHPSVVTGDPLVDANTDDSTLCNYCVDNIVTVSFYDSFGDGWNGATMNVSDYTTGDSITSGTLGGGSFYTDDLCLVDGCYEVVVGGGTWDSEITFDFGSLLGAATGYYLVSVGAATCPILGCTDSTALNFDSLANSDDGSCAYICDIYVASASVDAAPSCNGASDAQATAFISGSFGDDYYLWSDGQTTSTATGLTAGTYTCTVTDSVNGCVATATVTIDPTPVITISATTFDATPGNTNGGVDVSVSGGTPCYDGASMSLAGTPSTTTQWASNVFDVVATSDLQITSIDQPTMAGMGQADVYYRLGSGSGYETALTGWIPAGSAMVLANVTGDVTNIPVSINVNAGETICIYVHGNGVNTIFGAGVDSTYNGVVSSDANLTIVSGFASGGAPGAGTTYPSAGSYDFGGNINYSLSSYTYAWSTGDSTEDVSGLGLGPVSLTVTDCNGCTQSWSGFILTNYVYGCTDTLASNYDASVNTDDGSCLYDGCTDSLATNYDASANNDDGSCLYSCAYYGYDETLTLTMTPDWFSAEVTWYLLDGNLDTVLSSGAYANGGAIDIQDVCVYNGCFFIHGYDSFGDGWAGGTLDVNDEAGNLLASLSLSASTFDSQLFSVGGANCTAGCTDTSSANYNPVATVDDGSCLDTIYGCTDTAAANTTPYANVDDGSCVYCSDTYVNVSVGGGSWQAEVSWTITNSAGTVVLSGGAPYNGDLCLADDCYTVDMADSFGDGWNGNVMDITDYANGALIASDGLATGSVGQFQFATGGVVCAVYGCTDATAVNYDPNANTDDGSCLYACTAAPYVETFDAGTGTWTVNGWLLDAGGTPSSGTGPLDDITGGGNYMFYETSFGFLPTISMTSECLDISTLTNPCLRWNYHMWGLDQGTLDVIVNGTNVWSMSGDQGNQWNDAQVDLSAFVGSNVTIEFVGTHSGGSWQGDMAIDQIHVDECITLPVYGCIDSTATNYDPAADTDDGSCYYPCYDNMVDLNMYDSWGDGWNGATYTITDIATGTVIQTGGLATGIFQLDSICLPDGCYEIVVGGGSFDTEITFDFAGLVGATVGTYNVPVGISACPVWGCMDSTAINYDPNADTDDGSCIYACTAAPYCEGFEAGTGTWTNNGWTINSGGTPSLGTGPSSGANGSTWYMYYETSGAPQTPITLTSECLDISTLSTPTLAFYYHMLGATMGTLEVYVNGNLEWSLSGDQGDQWAFAQVDLSAYAGGNVTIDMVGNYGTSFTGDMAIDEICVQDYLVIDGCTDPAALNYDPSANNDDGSCSYCADNNMTLVMNDSFGDGWNGNTFTATGTSTGNVYGPFTLASGLSGTIDICMVDDCYDIVVDFGSWQGEVSWSLLDASGNTVASGGAPYSDIYALGANSVCPVYGCTDSTAANYDPAADTDDGSCDYLGCTNPTATNYDANATIDDGSCIFACTDNNVTVTSGGGTWDSEISWDIYDAAGNMVASGAAGVAGPFCLPDDCYTVNMYDAFGDGWNGGIITLSDDAGNTLATDAGPATSFGSFNVALGSALCSVPGCTDSTANNYDPNANTDDGSCTYDVLGCTDPLAFNYDPAATLDDGSCVAVLLGCTDPNAVNYYAAANTDDGSCLYAGCTDSTANNYDANATIDDGSCTYDVLGCTDSTANNYDPAATADDGSCTYDVYGCTDASADNYDANATIDDGSCTYTPTGCPELAPTGLFASGVIQNRATINWDNMNDSVNGCVVDQYRIKFRIVGTSSWTQKTMGQPVGSCLWACNKTDKLILNLTPSSTYEYQMKAWYCGGGSSAWTALETFTTLDDCPNVGNLAVTSGSTTQATFTWDDSNGAYSFMRIKARVDTTGAAWFNVGGAGVAYGTFTKNKNGLTAGESYRGQARTWCDPNGGAYKSPTWTSLLFWTQPTSRVEVGTAIANLDVYPNPSRDVFHVAFTSEDVQDLEVRVINVVGEVIFTDNLEQFVGEYTKQIDLATYTKGVYFLEITTNNGVVNKKLILQ